MADVDDLRLGSDPQNDPFHGANEMIVKSEVSRKSDDRGACQSVSSLNPQVSGTHEVSGVAGQHVKEHSAVSTQYSAKPGSQLMMNG